jgi:hypothetical protein
MTDRPMAFDDQNLEAALRSLSSAIDWPTAAPMADGALAGPDIATRVRVRLASGDHRRARRWWWVAGRPVRRGLVLAIIALLAFAIVAAAVGLGLPGLRFSFGEPPASLLPSPTLGASVGAISSPGPTPSPTLPPVAGMKLGLGRQVALDEVESLTGTAAHLPGDARLGPPDSVWVDQSRANQVAYVWASSDELPESLEPGVGLILMRFDGTTDDEYYEKAIHSGTTLTRVKVDGHDGYWISGDPHFFFYQNGEQGFVDDGRRWVGDALVWSDGTTTYRIESALGREATKAIAESIK